MLYLNAYVVSRVISTCTPGKTGRDELPCEQGNALQYAGRAGRRWPDRAASTQRPIGSIRTPGFGGNASSSDLYEVRGDPGNERQYAEKGCQQSEDIPFHT